MKSERVYWGAAFLMVVVARGPAFAQKPERPADDDVCSSADPKSDGPLKTKVDAVIGPWKREGQLPGVIVVVRTNRRTHYFSCGKADKANHVDVKPDSLFELASVTKVFTALSLGMEVTATPSQMQLSDTAAQYIPVLQNRGTDIKTVTLQELGTHTSSLPRTPTSPGADRWERKQLMDWLAAWKAPYPPGTKYEYSNVAFGLLGDVVATHEKKKLLDVWQSQFLTALGMTNTYFEVPDSAKEELVQGYNAQGAPVPPNRLGAWPAAGRLKSSGRDMGQLLVAAMGERTDLPAITRAMSATQKGYFVVSPKLTMGLAWQGVTIGRQPAFDKNGGLDGTSTYVGFLPGSHIGVVIMTNKGKAHSTVTGRKLLAKLAGTTYEGGAQEDDETE